MGHREAVKVVHNKVRGRARFSVSALVRSPEVKRILESELSGHGDIQEVRGNTDTGNLLVTFRKDLDHRVILQILEKLLRELKPRPGRRERPGRAGVLPARRVGRSVGITSQRGATGSKEPWHAFDEGAVLTLLGCRSDFGLSHRMVAERLETHGPNAVRELAIRSPGKILFEQISAPPLLLLGATTLLSVLTGTLLEAAALALIIAGNVTLGYLIDRGAEKAIDSMRRRGRPRSLVIREGRPQEVRGEGLVIGDLLILKAGTFVGADSRIIEARQLKIDESLLTGESMPVEKTSAPLRTESAPLVHRTNMAYMGTLVVGGEGLAVVVAVGELTEFGRLHSLLVETLPPKTPMVTELEHTTKRLLQTAMWASPALFFLGLIGGAGFLKSLKAAMSLAATMMPAGLPSAVTLNMAIGARRAKGHDLSLKRLHALETLGSVDLICFDKTGTLTRSRISVLQIFAGPARVTIRDRHFYVDGIPVDPLHSADVRILLQACILCNEAKIETEPGVDQFRIRGTPTEAALLHLVVLSGSDISSLYEQYPLRAVLHRGEKRRHMVTVHDSFDERLWMFVKGDPREVLEMCSSRIREGMVETLAPEGVLEIESQNDDMAGEALRVLGFAYKVVAQDREQDSEKDFTWIGLVGMAEPIRKGVPEMMDRLHRAGIDTVMITGDQNRTAHAVARKVRLAGDRDLKVLDSSRFDTLDADLLQALAKEVHVYSRVSPFQKLQIVRAYQGRGRVVAMTGDGINDGPALRAADIGIAMGIAGTDVAREVAEVIIDRDDIATMVHAVEEGRVSQRNLRHSIRYFLTTNLSEIGWSFFSMVPGVGHPLLSLQPARIDVFADILPGLALLMDCPPAGIMDERPRDVGHPLLAKKELGTMALESANLLCGALAGYGYGILRYGMGPQAVTIAYESFTISKLLHALVRSPEDGLGFGRGGAGANGYLKFALGLSLGLQALKHLVPGLREALGFASLRLEDFAMIGLAALLSRALGDSGRRRAPGQEAAPQLLDRP
ncbi:MAG: HAD-IC family P-type ATPase [Thermodesulfobacteriota bacterium]